MAITADQVYYVKLGAGGCYAEDCLKNGTIRTDFREIPHNLCTGPNVDWEDVYRHGLSNGHGRTPAACRNLTNQLRVFCEADSSVLWITFHANRLWWCFANPGVTRLVGELKERSTVSGWSNRDVHGQLLLQGDLSGALTAVAKYKGTICRAPELEYLLHKINGTQQPRVAKAKAAYENLERSLLPLIKHLHEKDFEILIDLIFMNGGWQRVGVSGGTEKDIDLDLKSPITKERIAVQVKSTADVETCNRYRKVYAEMEGYERFYFVTHTPSDNLVQLMRESRNDPQFEIWVEEDVAKQVIRSGLTGWLLDKAG